MSGAFCITDPRLRQIAWPAHIAGLTEIILGLLLLWWRQRWPLLLVGALLIGLLLDVALFSPHLLLQAFNPLNTNLAALALCWVAWRAETLQLPPH